MSKCYEDFFHSDSWQNGCPNWLNPPPPCPHLSAFSWHPPAPLECGRHTWKPLTCLHVLYAYPPPRGWGNSRIEHIPYSLFFPFMLLNLNRRGCRSRAALSGVLLLSSAFCCVLRTASLKRSDVGGHLMRRQTEHEVSARVAKWKVKNDGKREEEARGAGVTDTMRKVELSQTYTTFTYSAVQINVVKGCVIAVLVHGTFD